MKERGSESGNDWDWDACRRFVLCRSFEGRVVVEHKAIRRREKKKRKKMKRK
jgi:hypothetical protein